MTDILIRGMEMPKENEILVFDVWHGKVYARSTANLGTKSYEVFPLPEGHGRLGDLEIAEAILHNKAFDLAGTSGEYNALMWALRQIKALPTIVPSEGGGEDGN